MRGANIYVGDMLAISNHRPVSRFGKIWKMPRNWQGANPGPVRDAGALYFRITPLQGICTYLRER
ncbi:MAG: hypothetical protein A4E42_00870 [Methanoregulaceae archaeon PtaU1.Bin222]|nr:MAG: hypothetical protein A4E42_00870 [Methanoregulaceae archaeon PtaU1.Bin222]